MKQIATVITLKYYNKMKQFTLIIGLLVCLFIGSCGKKMANQNMNNLSQDENDTILIQNTCVLSFAITDEKINDIKLQYPVESDFYTVTDDAAYYYAIADDYLQEKDINIIEIKGNKMLNFNNQYFIDSRKIKLFGLIFYKEENKPIIIAPIDVKYEYDKYYGPENADTNEFDIDGYWRINCDDRNTILQINSDSSVWMSIISPSIFIYGKLESHNLDNNQYTIKYVEQDMNAPASGDNIIDPNNNISKEKIIANIKISDEFLYLLWFGLFDESTQKWIYINDSEFGFDAGNHSVKLIKCLN